MDIENNTENNTEKAQSNYVTKEELEAMFLRFKEENAGMVSGAVNRAIKQNKALEDKMTSFQESFTQFLESQKVSEDTVVESVETPSDAVPNEPETNKLNLMEQMVQKLENRLREQELENQKAKEESDRLRLQTRITNTKNELINVLREKEINDPETLLGIMENVHGLITFKDNPASDKGAFVFPETNQYGEPIEIPFKDKIDEVIKSKYSYMLRERPGNGLSSQQPGSQSNSQKIQFGSELPMSLLNDPNAMQKLIENI